MAHQVVCQGCGKTFTAKRADARFHDTACRARSHRQRTDLVESNPIKPAFEAVLAFELRVLQAQQVGEDVGLLQAARRGSLVTALATIETELSSWRESDPSGYESALMMARANAEQASRMRREAMAESATSNVSMESETALVETSTPEANESAASNASMESEPKRAHRSRARTIKTPRRNAEDLEGLRAGLQTALAAGKTQRTIANEVRASQSQISRFASGQGLSESARTALAEWLNQNHY